MHPVLFSVGSFRLPTYGVIVVIAILAGIYTVSRLGRREGLDTGRLFDFSTWIVIVALLGAKLMMVLVGWRIYWERPSELVSWSTIQAGGVFYGGFIAAVVFALWYTRANHMPRWKVFDVYAPAVALGLGLGRIGCFAAGCDYGKPTSSAMGVVFTNSWSHELTGVPLGVPLHPTQLYETAASLAIFGWLLWLFRRKRYDGQIFLHYLALYAVVRFFIEYLRGDADRGFVLGGALSTSQFIALLALAAAAGLAYHFRARREGGAAAAAPAAGRSRR